MKPIFVSLSLSLCTLPLIACTGGERAQSGECPAGELCSPDTPNGLHFLGDALSDQLLGTAFGPAPTAVGGTQDIALEYDRGNGVFVPFNLPYAADDDGGEAFTIDETAGSVVTILGTGSRTRYLRIVDPSTQELYDRKELSAATLKRMALIGTDFEMLPPGEPSIVWAPGDQEIGVALYGDVQDGNANVEKRIVDNSMQLVLAGGLRTEWDAIRLPTATPGTYDLTITAGDKPAASLPIEIVAAPTDVTIIGGAARSVPANGSETICFAAMHGQRYVYGLTWTFTVDGATTTKDGDDLSRNCIVVTTTKTSGTVAVSGSAGGLTASLTVNVGATPRLATDAMALPGRSSALLRTETTAGERALED